MDSEHLKYILALRYVKGIGDKLAQKIISSFDSPSEIFSTSRTRLLKIEGVGENLFNEIKSFSDWDLIEKQIKMCKKYGFKIVSFLDDDYPKNLLNIFDYPTILYCFGEIKDTDDHSISIVGSRSANGYGRSVTRKLTEGLVEKGVTIVSGMARGIDTFAHQEAIRCGGRTIAVLGSGLNEIYPPENINLYRKIPENGALISEFPLGTKPEAQNFPRRNRVISGISMGVVIVQASIKSGSLITARFALEQNREVFAIPGDINSKLSEGTNALIQRGAKLVRNVDDILNEIECFSDAKVNLSNNNKYKYDTDDLTEEEKTILKLVCDDALHVDEIIKVADIEDSEIFKLLLDMELKGLVDHLPGNFYASKF